MASRPGRRRSAEDQRRDWVEDVHNDKYVETLRAISSPGGVRTAAGLPCGSPPDGPYFPIPKITELAALIRSIAV